MAEEDSGEEMLTKMTAYSIKMGGYEVHMIIKKKLMATDMMADQGQLSLQTKDPIDFQRSSILA